jgi:hypothetical protein
VGSDPMQRVENDCRIRNTADMEYSLEQMARSLVDSGEYRVTSRLEPQAEYHPPDNSPKLVAAVVDVETTGTIPIATRSLSLASASSNMTVRTGGSTESLAPGSGSKIPAFPSRLRSRTLPASPMRWSPVTASTSEPSTIC